MNATRVVSPPPGARTRPAAEVRPRQPTRFFDRPGLTVTDHALVVAGRQYPLAELSDLKTVRGPQDPLAVRALVATGVVLVGVGALLTMSSQIGRLNGTAYLAITVAVAAPLLMAFMGFLRPRAHELWGEFHGLTVQLLYTDNGHEFGQVTRALVRAKEIARQGGSAELWELDPYKSWQKMARR